jgi:phosphoadenosine phosphosulfate reductase
VPAGGRVKGVEATKLYRSIMKPVYWHLDYRVLVVGDGWPRGSVRRIRVTQPGDVRPALEHDVEVVRRALEESVGRRAAQRLLPPGLIYLNRIQAIDAADEVIAGGLLIGARIYDIYMRRWLFRPDRGSAQLIVEEALGYYARLRGRIHAGMVVERSAVVEGEPPPQGYYVAVVDERGWYGVAKVTSAGKLRILKAWPGVRSPERPGPGGDRRKLLEAMAGRLEELERDAVSFLERVKRLGETMVAVSGGKDSTVAAALAVKAGIRRAYFFDTGIEFPETVETASRVAEALDLDMVEISAGTAFWDALKIFGPPARDYRWCCKVVKFAPLAKALKPLVKTRLVTVTGQRAFESTQRARAGRLSPSATTGRRDLLAAPIQEWTSLEVYAYIWREGLPLNPVYGMGYERVGCYLCPTSRMAEIELARKKHPHLWGPWEEYLYQYARRRGLPREWVEYGFWRWRFSYPAEIEYLARRLGLNPGKMIERLASSYAAYSLEFTWQGPCHRLNLTDVRFEPREVLNLLSTTGLHERARMEADGTIVVVDEQLGVTVRLYPSGVMELCGNPKSVRRTVAFARRVLAPVYMAGSCYGCEVCVAACPTGAMTAAHTVDPSRCARCANCTYICPAGGKLAHHALLILEKRLEETMRETVGARGKEEAKKMRR